MALHFIDQGLSMTLSETQLLRLIDAVYQLGINNGVRCERVRTVLGINDDDTDVPYTEPITLDDGLHLCAVIGADTELAEIMEHATKRSCLENNLGLIEEIKHV